MARVFKNTDNFILKKKNAVQISINFFFIFAVRYSKYNYGNTW